MTHEHAIDLLLLWAKYSCQNARVLDRANPVPVRARAYCHAAKALSGDPGAWVSCTWPSDQEHVVVRLGDEAGEMMAIGNVDAARTLEDAAIALMAMR